MNHIVRRLFMVLSPRSLPYARLALGSLFRNCVDHISLSLITDFDDDVRRLEAELTSLGDKNRTAAVYGIPQLGDLERDKFASFRHISDFRRGHPCWRKIVDPILLSDDNQEMIVLDPDLYFPNRFQFELTPARGVLLMWQRPSCLLPPEIVEAAIEAEVPLAHHTDIGVAQWRMPVDLEWLDWLIGRLGSSQLPRNMHVESIVWAALAMHIGGGYLDPKRWVCWRRTQYKRILVKLGVPGATILNSEQFSGVKCFHAGGEAKWWLRSAQARGILDCGQDVTDQSVVKPYQELTPSKYFGLQRNRQLLRKFGYYSVFGS